MVGNPTADQLNNKPQDVVQWDAKSYRVTQVNENGDEINSNNPLPVSVESSVLTSSTDVEAGGKISVGTTAVEITFTGTTRNIIITADIDNSGLLFVGKSDVSSSGANSLTFLQPGDILELDYDDSSNALYIVSDTASQYFWKGATL